MTSGTALRLIPMLTLSLAVGACSLGSTSSGSSGSSGSASQPTELAICKVFSTDELKAVMGKEMGTPDARNINDDPKFPYCHVATSDGTADFSVEVDNTMSADDARTTVSNYPSVLDSSVPTPSPTTLGGVGDDSRAYLGPNPLGHGPAGKMAILKGSSVVYFEVTNSTPAPTLKLLKDLGTKFIARTDPGKVHL